MIGESAQHRVERSSGEWIANFQVALTTRYLPDVSPRRGGIVDQRIIHPLSQFMTQGMNVLDRNAENPRVTVRRDRIGLIAQSRAVIAENAAPSATGPENVVVEKQRQAGGRNGQGGNQIVGDGIEVIDIDGPHLLASAKRAQDSANAWRHNNARNRV